MVYIFYAFLSQNKNNKLLSKYESYLKEYFNNGRDIKKYKNWRDIQASLLGRVLLKKGLSYLRINIKNLKIKYFKNDKPYLINSSLFFNISHTNDLVLCVIYNKEVGIDVERIKNIDTELFKILFKNKEYTEISNSKNKNILFFEYWTKRESFYKTNEKIFFNDLEHLNFSDDIINYKNEKYFFRSMIFKSIYMVSICSKNDEFKFDKIFIKRLYWNSNFKEISIL